MTATVTPAPLVTDHAPATSSMFSTHCCLSWMLSATAARAAPGGSADRTVIDTRPVTPTRASLARQRRACHHCACHHCACHHCACHHWACHHWAGLARLSI